jgi:hypothetical protein
VASAALFSTTCLQCAKMLDAFNPLKAGGPLAANQDRVFAGRI